MTCWKVSPAIYRPVHVRATHMPTLFFLSTGPAGLVEKAWEPRPPPPRPPTPPLAPDPVPIKGGKGGAKKGKVGATGKGGKAVGAAAGARDKPEDVPVPLSPMQVKQLGAGCSSLLTVAPSPVGECQSSQLGLSRGLRVDSLFDVTEGSKTAVRSYGFKYELDRGMLYFLVASFHSRGGGLSQNTLNV